MNFNNIVFEKSFGTFSQLPASNLPEICFSGRSNVGKSSIINKTVGRKSLARVSTKPGKTVTINFYKIDNIRLADLPGYGFAKVNFNEKTRWSELMEGYFKSGRNIPIVFQLIDMRHPATEFDISMLEFLKECGFNYCIILTKADKLNKTEFSDRLLEIKEQLGKLGHDVEIIPTSASSGLGTDRIRQIISDISENFKNCEI